MSRFAKPVSTRSAPHLAHARRQAVAYRRDSANSSGGDVAFDRIPPDVDSAEEGVLCMALPGGRALGMIMEAWGKYLGRNRQLPKWADLPVRSLAQLKLKP